MSRRRVTAMQLLEASTRVGRDVVERMEWLCRFASADWPSTSRAAQARWAEEVAAYVSDLYGGRLTQDSCAWTDQELAQAHTQARAWLTEWVRNKEVILELGRTHVWLKEAEPHTPPRRQFSAAHGIDRFTLAVCLDLSHVPKWIRQCAYRPCSKYFLTTRPQQRFCTMRCTSRHSSRQHRARQRTTKRHTTLGGRHVTTKR